ncbi:MAG: phospho-N-acetylmuramoyl-pentapeptide-transferase [Clostridiales bacterium]|nr:phospho-N-acetylmuramoyl-pentapeptide-transferase [Clostridiales bacterium]
MLNFFLVFIVSFVVAVVIGFPVLKICKKFHLSQTILHYVDNHSGKAGTPTMGGWIFLIASLSSLFFLSGEVLQGCFVLLISFSYGFLGFLDDFIKIKYRQNEGLKPYQKIIGQVGIALIVAIYVYLNFGGRLDLFGFSINLEWWIIPFVVIFFVAVTNAVNLTDGLDGLAGGVSFVYFIIFGVLLAVIGGFDNFAIISFAMAGAVLGFLLFNGFPAKIFMGDTGSLALGGVIASLASFSGLELIMPIIGVMFVLSVLSDVLQVGYFKLTKGKRIFKMAPLHHHFEKSGVHENKIVISYIVATLIAGLIVLLGYLTMKGVL